MANVPISNMTATWTDSGTTYTAVKMNVTDTASNAASLLLDLQTNGTSSFRITKGDPVLIGAGNSGRISYSSLAGSITFGTASNALRCGYVNTSAGLAERLSLASDLPIGFTATTSALGAIDTILARDNAANTLGQRNATNPQNFRVYNTYTDASNYERVSFGWTGSIAYITTAAAGAGMVTRSLNLRGSELYLSGSTAGDQWYFQSTGNLLPIANNTYDIGNSSSRVRYLYLGTALNLGGTSQIQATNGTVYVTGAAETTSGTSNYIKSINAAALTFGTSNTDRWQISTAGNFVAATDNTYDIGASGANRPRNVYIAGTADVGNGNLSLSSDVRLSRRSSGVLLLDNNGGTDFGRLQFGGTTSSFPSLKRSATALQCRLADDTAFAPLEASTIGTSTAYTVATLPAAGTAGRRAYVTDATAPTWLGALTGGGAVKCPVFDNGTAWVAG